MSDLLTSDLRTGLRIGSLTIIGRTDEQRKRRLWECECVCGKSVIAAAANLIRFKTEICICDLRTKLSSSNLRHGQTGSDEHRTWVEMRKRCLNTEHKRYQRYGGRGIAIDPRWDDFSTFLADIGPKPGPEYSIERRDNDGPYSPANCFWATRVEQANNKGTNRVIEYDGRTQTLAQWAREVGLSQAALERRLNLLKWSVEKSITTPARGWGPGKPRSSISG